MQARERHLTDCISNSCARQRVIFDASGAACGVEYLKGQPSTVLTSAQ